MLTKIPIGTEELSEQEVRARMPLREFVKDQQSINIPALRKQIEAQRCAARNDIVEFLPIFDIEKVNSIFVTSTSPVQKQIEMMVTKGLGYNPDPSRRAYQCLRKEFPKFDSKDMYQSHLVALMATSNRI